MCLGSPRGKFFPWGTQSKQNFAQMWPRGSKICQFLLAHFCQPLGKIFRIKKNRLKIIFLLGDTACLSMISCAVQFPNCYSEPVDWPSFLNASNQCNGAKPQWQIWRYWAYSCLRFLAISQASVKCSHSPHPFVKMPSTSWYALSDVFISQILYPKSTPCQISFLLVGLIWCRSSIDFKCIISYTYGPRTL